MRKKLANSMLVSFLMMLLMTVSSPAQIVLADEFSETQYSVQKNDNLYKIAQAQLNSGERWTEIFELNKDTIKDPSLIYTGQLLKLPASVQDQTTLNEKQEADRCAQQLYDAAAKEEPYITAVLRSLESENAHLEGLEFRLKSAESTSRKILSNAHDMEISVSEAAKNINDSLRYTYVIEESNYVDTTKLITDALIAAGFTVTKFKNFWANKDVAYQGINALFKSKEGVIFELQFHTPVSYYTKGEKTHGYYEIIRSETATEEEKADATKKHDEAFAQIPVPAGVETLSY